MGMCLIVLPFMKCFIANSWQDIYEYQSPLFIYAYLNNKLPSSFDGKLPNIRDVLGYRDTRQSDNFFIPGFSSKYAQKLYAYHLPKLWNKCSNKKYGENSTITNITSLSGICRM